MPQHLTDHTYSIPTDIYKIIDQQYADNISWADINTKHKIEETSIQLKLKVGIGVCNYIIFLTTIFIYANNSV